VSSRTKLTPSEWSSHVNNLEFPEPLIANVFGPVVVGVIARAIAFRQTQAKAFVIRLGTAGTSGTTRVEVRRNGQPLLLYDGAQLSISSADPDGTVRALSLGSDLNPSDLVEIVVLEAAEGAEDLTAELDVVRRFS
jgi:hypothetical protein